MNYTHTNRGILQYPQRGRQIVSFAGMRYTGNNSPTDIDMVVEYHDTVMIVYEFKLRGADMPRGQSTTLTRIVDALTKAGKHSALFFCEHDVADPRDEIDAATAIVTRVYFGGRWYEGRGRTVAEQTTLFLRKYGQGAEIEPRYYANAN